MSDILIAASNAATTIIKNIVSATDDDNKSDLDYDPSNAADQSLAAKDKIEDSFGYNADDSKEMEAEPVDYAELVSDEMSDTYEEEEQVKESESAALESEQQSVDESLSKEMESALAHVRKLALFQKESLVNHICDTYSSFNGREPSVNDLLAIFNRIKKQLAEEAAEDNANYNEFDDEADSDYSPADGEDNLQFLKDLQEDGDSSSVEAESYESDGAVDSDYDPKDARDAEQAMKDKEDDAMDTDSDESEKSEKTETEEKIINSAGFDDEYFAAIECVRNTAKSDKEKILKKIKEEYQDVFGEDTTNEIIMEAFEQFVYSEDEEQESDEEQYSEEEYEEEVEEEVDPKDMELALEYVRKLGKQHQSKLVENIATTFKIMNGFEPSEEDITALYKDLKDKFADEAREDFLDQMIEQKEDEEE